MQRVLHRTRSMSATAAAAAAPTAGPLATSIQQKLQAALQPLSLTIQNDSHKHAGHSGNPSGAPDAETHFKVEVVSKAFEGKNPVQRHRIVYQLLQAEIDAGVHALALKTKTPSEAGLQRKAGGRLEAAVRPALVRLAARYLLRERRRGLALDPVANFHLRNGAAVLQLNWRADLSAAGLQRSHGVMVNYVYELDRLQDNNRAYLVDGSVAAGPAAEALLGRAD